MKSRFLVRVENIAGRLEKNPRPVRGQARVVETAGIFSSLNGKARISAQRFYCGDAVGDGIVAETSGFAKDQHFHLLVDEGAVLGPYCSCAKDE